MSKFLPSNRSNDCQVCGDNKGKCKTKNDGGQEFWLCVTEAASKKFDVLNGWKCIKPAGSSRWATFAVDGATPQISQDERTKLRQQREAEERQRYKSGLAPDERHHNHLQLTTQLALHSVDRADLLRRDLPEHVINTLVSVEPWQVLPTGLNPKTPGIGENGKKVLTKYSGYMVPALDLDAQIQGYQIRNRASVGDAPKYPWLSTHSNPVNLHNGCLPLTFCRGSAQPEGKPVYLAEGLLKPLVASLRHDINVMGAAGGMFASSAVQFVNWVNALKPSKLILCPDGGALSNPDVMREYTKLAELISETGRLLQVQWWEQTEKVNGDIDEITPKVFRNSRLISWAEFAAMVPREEPEKPGPKPVKISAIATVKKLDKKAEKSNKWLADMAKVAGLSAQVKPTRKAINQALTAKQLLPQNHAEGTYQPLTLAPTHERRLYVLDGQKGTRKTSVAAKSLVDAAKAVDQTCLVIEPSRLLSRDASRVLDTACHLDKDAEHARYLTTCPESMYKFARQQWDVVVFDEVNEDIQRAFDGSLGVNPELCQKVLHKILETASTIAIANDQTYRVSVAAVQRIAGIAPQEVVTIQKKRKPSDVTINLYLDYSTSDEDDEENTTSSNDAFYGWFARLVEAIKAGGKVAIPCGAQTRARSIDRVLRAYFGRRFRGQVLDGQFTPAKIKSEFAADPDNWLVVNQPAWLIWTPCFNSGISFESEYFTAQFEALSGFEGASAASQRGERVRAVIKGETIKERHVFASNRGLPAFPDPQIFKAAYWRNLATATIDGRTEPTDRAFSKALGADVFLKRHNDELKAALDNKSELFEYWAIGARELYFKLESLQAEWLGNGWTIAPGELSKKDTEVWKTAFNEAKQSIVLSKSRALGKARPVAGEGQDLSPFAAVRAKKHHLKEQLGDDFAQLNDSDWLESWAIAPDNSGGIKAQRINTLIKMSAEAPDLWAAVCQLDTLRAVGSAAEVENLPSLPIPAKEVSTAKILIQCPGVVEVVTGRLQRWNKTHKLVLDAAKFLRDNAQRLSTLTKHSQRVLGLQFKETTPVVSCFNKALDMAGVTAQASGQIKKVWQYRLKTSEDIEKQHAAKEEKGTQPSYADIRDLRRSLTLEHLRTQLDTRIVEVIKAASEAWQSVANEIAAICATTAPKLMPSSLGISHDVAWELIPDDEPAETNTEAVKSWMQQLAWYVSDADGYEQARTNLESLGLNFERDCWSQLSRARQHQICSYFPQSQAA